MSTQSAAPGEPARLLALLWRHQRPTPARRGPRPTRTVDDVVRAATDLADTKGLAALSMRTVAEAVDVSTMSLYTYVPGKDELVALMVDAAYAAMSRPDLADLPWERRLQTIADANLLLVQHHPWLAGVSAARPPLGPGVMAKYEHELSAFDHLGLDDITTDDCLTVLLTFVHGTARTAIAADEDRRSSGLTDEQWWQANGPLLAEVLDQNAFPRATRIGTAAGAANGSAYDPQRAYAFGLQRILAGVSALITNPRDTTPLRP